MSLMRSEFLWKRSFGQPPKAARWQRAVPANFSNRYGIIAMNVAPSV